MKHFSHGWPRQSQASALGAAIAVAILAAIAAGLIGTLEVPTAGAVRIQTGPSGGINSLVADPKQSLELVPLVPSIAPDAVTAQPIDTF